MEKQDLILKWLDNDLTPEEQKELRSMEGFDAYQKIIDHAEYFSNRNMIDTQKGFEDLQGRLESKPKVISLTSRIRYAVGIAATFAVLLTSYLFFQGQAETGYTAAMAEQTSVALPDASTVELNADSEILFNEKTWNRKRTLKLKGEAFFRVEKGSDFTVQTSDGWVQVLGTQFNVYTRDNIFRVSCYEGAVKVGFSSLEYELHPGEEIQISNGEITEREISGDTPSWMDGRSHFESVPLAYVFKELERQYNISITRKKTLDTPLYTGAFLHNDLEQALESVCTPFNLNYEIEGNTVKISAVEE